MQPRSASARRSPRSWPHAVARQRKKRHLPPLRLTAAPTSGTEGQTRGAGGELKLLQWQAPSTLNMQLAGSFKDQLASCLVTEPLLHFLPDGTPIPCLVKEVPSQENGLVSADLKTVTYNLLEGVVWSDGEPFTADDVVFTWKWVTDPAQPIGQLRSLRCDRQHRSGRTRPRSRSRSRTHNSGGTAISRPLRAAASCRSTSSRQVAMPSTAFASKPIGTGPYVVDSFAANDSVQYSINPKYREPNKPYFAKVNLKGGGDAPTAAQAVLQTGDWDFAWNLLVDPEILRKEAETAKATSSSSPDGSRVHRPQLLRPEQRS